MPRRKAGESHEEAEELTPEQRKLSKLKKRITTYKSNALGATELMAVSKMLLDENDMGHPIDRNELMMDVKDLLPSPKEIFVEEFFSSPMLPIRILKDTMTLFGWENVTIGQAKRIGLTDEEIQSPFMMTYAWFLNLFDLNKDSATKALRLCRSSRTVTPHLRTRIESPNHAAGEGSAGRQEENPVQARPHESNRVQCEIGSIRGPADQTNAPVRPSPLETTSSARDVPAERGLNRDEISARAGRALNITRDPGLSKKIAGIHNHFKDQNFSGDLNQNIHEALAEYEECAAQHEFNEKQKSDLMGNIFVGLAKNFIVGTLRLMLRFM